MVVLEGHARVHRRVDLHIDVVADLERAQVHGQGNETLLPEAPREQVPRPGAHPMTGRHAGSRGGRRPPWRDWTAG